MQMFTHTLVGSCAALALAAGAQAQFQFLTQSRTVAAETNLESDSTAAPGFAFFDEEVSAVNPSISASSSALQESSLGTERIFGSGSASLTAFNVFDASAESSFETTFSVDEAIEYTLVAELMNPDNSVFEIIGPMDEQIAFLGFDFDTNSFETELDTTGVLEPGEYRIRAVAATSEEGDAFDASSSFLFDFAVVPAPSAGALLVAGGLLGVRRRRR